MPGKRVLDVGNCPFDHSALRRLLESRFQAEVVQTHGSQDTLEKLRSGTFDLVLVNRKLDRDDSDGLDIVRQITTDPQLPSTPVMLITNFPEHQQRAIEAGAEPGFGKLELDRDETRQKLARFLA